MFGPQKPFIDLSIAGTPSGLILGGNLKEFIYRDVHHGEVDEISFRLADGSGLWRGGWGIDEGTEISGLMGYAGLLGAKVPCGLYAVGETEAQGGGGSGDVALFHAQAAFTSKELRTERSEAYEKMKLEDIIGKVADRHGFELIGEIPDLSFKRITQDKQNDLNFGTRLAEDWGCYFSVKGNQMVFTTRESIEEASAVRGIISKSNIPDHFLSGFGLPGAAGLKNALRKSCSDISGISYSRSISAFVGW